MSLEPRFDHLPHDVAAAIAAGGDAVVVAALRAVWNRASPLLGCAMAAAVFGRAVDDVARAQPALARRGLAVARRGFSFAERPADGDDDLPTAATALLDELLATTETLLGATLTHAVTSDLEALARVHRVLALRGILKAVR